MIEGKESHRVYAVFCEGRRFWWLPLKKGFSHCYVVKDCGDTWVKCQPYMGFTDVTLWPKYICPNIEDLTGFDGETVVPYDLQVNYDKIRGNICFFNCVEVVKSFLGIKSFFTFTPYQLYRLIK